MAVDRGPEGEIEDAATGGRGDGGALVRDRNDLPALVVLQVNALGGEDGVGGGGEGRCAEGDDRVRGDVCAEGDVSLGVDRRVLREVEDASAGGGVARGGDVRDVTGGADFKDADAEVAGAGRPEARVDDAREDDLARVVDGGVEADALEVPAGRRHGYTRQHQRRQLAGGGGRLVEGGVDAEGGGGGFAAEVDDNVALAVDGAGAEGAEPAERGAAGRRSALAD